MCWGVVFTALALEIYLAATQDIHQDEVASWCVSSFAPATVFSTTLDMGWPPLYYAVLSVWRSIFGDSLIGMRMLSIVCNVVSVACGYFLCKLAIGDRQGARYFGLAAATLIAASPFRMEESVRVGPTAMQIALFFSSTLLALLLATAIPKSTVRNSAALSAYCLLAVAFVLVLENGWLYVAIQGVTLAVVWGKQRHWRRVAWSTLPFAVVLLTVVLGSPSSTAGERTYGIQDGLAAGPVGFEDVLLGTTSVAGVGMIALLLAVFVSLFFCSSRPACFVAVVGCAGLLVVVLPTSLGPFPLGSSLCLAGSLGVVGLVVFLGAKSSRATLFSTCLLVLVFAAFRGNRFLGAADPGVAAVADEIVNLHEKDDLVVVRKQYLYHALSYYLPEADFYLLESHLPSVLFESIGQLEDVRLITHEDVRISQHPRVMLVATSGTVTHFRFAADSRRLQLLREIDALGESVYISLYQWKERPS